MSIGSGCREAVTIDTIGMTGLARMTLYNLEDPWQAKGRRAFCNLPLA